MGQVFTATGIEIQDSTGSAIIDTTGVVSTFNFTTAGTDTTDDTFTGTGWVSFTGGTQTVITSRNSVVLMYHSGYGSVASGNTIEQQLFVGTAAIPSTTFAPPLVYNSTTKRTESITIITTTVFQGTNNFVMRGRVIGGGQGVVDNGQMGVIVLGK